MTEHDPHDLTNARKVLVELRHHWAKAIAASDNTEIAIKSIIEVQQAIDVMSAGHRIDESAPGYGFGLPITRELAELYGGSVALGRSRRSGLRAAVRLPAAA